ncbi:hypothetical protein BX616_003562, partial [Lobosporangium transversale]
SVHSINYHPSWLPLPSLLLRRLQLFLSERMASLSSHAVLVPKPRRLAISVSLTRAKRTALSLSRPTNNAYVISDSRS